MPGRLWLFGIILAFPLVTGVSAVQGQDDLPATIAALETRVAQLEAAATPTLPPASPIAPMPGELLYVADTSAGFDAWSLPGPTDGSTPAWKVERGLLINVGGVKGEKAIPPFSAPSDDYAVEVEAQILRFNPFPGSQERADFLITARGGSGGGVHAAVGTGCDGQPGYILLHLDAWYCGTIAKKDFNPGQDWHTYRLEVNGNDLRVFLDGQLQLEGLSNRVLTGEGVGLEADNVELGVRRFAVYSLTPQA